MSAGLDFDFDDLDFGDDERMAEATLEIVTSTPYGMTLSQRRKAAATNSNFDKDGPMIRIDGDITRVGVTLDRTSSEFDEEAWENVANVAIDHVYSGLSAYGTFDPALDRVRAELVSVREGHTLELHESEQSLASIEGAEHFVKPYTVGDGEYVDEVVLSPKTIDHLARAQEAISMGQIASMPATTPVVGEMLQRTFLAKLAVEASYMNANIHYVDALSAGMSGQPEKISANLDLISEQEQSAADVVMGLRSPHPKFERFPLATREGVLSTISGFDALRTHARDSEHEAMTRAVRGRDATESVPVAEIRPADSAPRSNGNAGPESGYVPGY